MTQILIYTAVRHPRLDYVLEQIQSYTSSCQWRLCMDRDEFASADAVCIDYGNHQIRKDAYPIPFTGWLNRPLAEYQHIPVQNEGGELLLFPSGQTGSFDLFAAVFYLLARVEEYLPFQEDALGRFPAQASLLYTYKSLRIPLVDQWVDELIRTLEFRYGQAIPRASIHPAWSLGIDVDQFYKYRHKSLIKTAGGMFRALVLGKATEFKTRFQVCSNSIRDPFDSYDRIFDLNIPDNQLLFFILSGGRSRFDKNHKLSHKRVSSCLHEIAQRAKVGLHPSYSSALDARSVALEKKNLEDALDKPVRFSRHHYLRIRFPQTYRLLLELKFQQDYSMGYPDEAGFRAGTCRPFYWYDLGRERQTTLLLFPIAAMDRCYLRADALSSEEIVLDLLELWQTCQRHGGHFHLNWHNSSLDFEGEWKGWENVLPSIIQQLQKHEAPPQSGQ